MLALIRSSFTRPQACEQILDHGESVRVESAYTRSSSSSSSSQQRGGGSTLCADEVDGQEEVVRAQV